MTDKRRVAVFDVDGTIFRSSLLIQLVEKLIEKRAFPRKRGKSTDGSTRSGSIARAATKNIFMRS
jgi:hypothetical protein